MKRTLPFAFLLFTASCQHAAAPSKPPPATIPAVASAPPPAPLPEYTSKDVDAALRAEWAKAGVTPSAPADDATYLRRVYIDVVGTLPPPDKVISYTADASPDKRAKLVDELLASPAYADHWTAYWDDELMGRTRMGDIDRQALRVWLHDQFAKNATWDKVVYELITATGINSAGGKVQKTLSEARTEQGDDERIDGAVNYVLKFRDTPQDFAGSASKTFLGVQIQCAQCHDHKTEPWKQVDFQKFAACFTRAQTVPVGEKDMKGIKTVMVRDINRPLPRFAKNADLTPITQAQPTTLDGTPLDGNVRQAVAHWITKNPWFAEEAVNRAWGHFLGRGFVNPVDDLRPSNPAVMGDLLVSLSKDFADHGYDPKRLIRTITQTEAYGLSAAAAANATVKGDAREIPLWSRFRLVPLGPEELVNALVGATGLEDALARMTRTDFEDLRARLTQLFSFVFDVDEEIDSPHFEGTITQALVLLNGKLAVGGTSARPGTALGAIAGGNGSDADKITALYLRTVSRRPSQEELAAAVDYVTNAPVPGDPPDAAPDPAPAPTDAKGKAKGEEKAKAKGKNKGKGKYKGPDPLRRLEGVPHSRDPKVAALEDIMWALVNSSEFVFNH